MFRPCETRRPWKALLRMVPLLAAAAVPPAAWMLSRPPGALGSRDMYRRVAHHAMAGLDTCFSCLRALPATGEPDIRPFEVAYSSTRGTMQTESVLVCGDCASRSGAAAVEGALEHWITVHCERMLDAERRGWLTRDAAQRYVAMYRRAVVVAE